MGKSGSAQRYTQGMVIEALERGKGKISAAAALLRCDPETIRHYMNRYPAVAKARYEIREALFDRVETRIEDMAETGTYEQALAFLRSQAKHRGWAEKVEHELTGAGGGAIQVRTVTAIVSAKAAEDFENGARGSLPDGHRADLPEEAGTGDDESGALDG